MHPPIQSAKISKDATLMKMASVRPNIFVQTKTITIEGTSSESTVKADQGKKKLTSTTTTKNVNKARQAMRKLVGDSAVPN